MSNRIYFLFSILKGISGLYAGYLATLLRNIPSAVIRFAVYEELKVYLGDSGWWRIMASGAVAGVASSVLTTPFDVIKTRVRIALFSFQ